jgi:LPXTG-motif cell wall-anchored protein
LPQRVLDVIDDVTALPDPITTTALADAVAAATNAFNALTATERALVPQSYLDALATAQTQAGVVNHASGNGKASGAVLSWNVRLTVAPIPSGDSQTGAFTPGVPSGASLLTLDDIFFTDTLTGASWEPPAGSTVTIDLSGVNVSGYTNIRVLHRTAGGTFETLAATVNGSTVTFTASSFSLFGVIGTAVTTPTTPGPTGPNVNTGGNTIDSGLGGNLPDTGANVGLLTLGAILFLLASGGALLLARRTRRAH